MNLTNGEAAVLEAIAQADARIGEYIPIENLARVLPLYTEAEVGQFARGLAEKRLLELDGEGGAAVNRRGAAAGRLA